MSARRGRGIILAVRSYEWSSNVDRGRELWQARVYCVAQLILHFSPPHTRRPGGRLGDVAGFSRLLTRITAYHRSVARAALATRISTTNSLLQRQMSVEIQARQHRYDVSPARQLRARNLNCFIFLYFSTRMNSVFWQLALLRKDDLCLRCLPILLGGRRRAGEQESSRQPRYSYGDCYCTARHSVS